MITVEIEKLHKLMQNKREGKNDGRKNSNDRKTVTRKRGIQTGRR